MSVKSIQTSVGASACDVCGRTLLRGERAAVYLDGAARHSVCELCTSRALHGGWVREGTVPEYGGSSPRDDRRRSLFGRLRGKRAQDGAQPEERDADESWTAPPGEVQDGADIAGDAGARPAPDAGAGAAPRAQETEGRGRSGGGARGSGGGSRGGWSRPVRAARSAATPDGRRAGSREPRHVHAVPTAVEHRIASAVGVFNASEQPRTIAGIARSLGLPDVAVHPSDATGSIVWVVVSWELCWYRYELDLGDESPSVRVVGQGYELSELSELERQINAGTDERGRLVLHA